MNEETKKAMDALAGAGAGGGDAGGDATDWKAKYEEAQRELNSARVEQGRVKKLDEECKALQRRLDEAEASRRSQSIIDELPDDLKRDVPDDYMKAQAEIARRTADQALAGQDERYAALERKIAEREARERATAQTRFAERIEREFPGFLLSAAADGGDKHDAWVQYQRYNSQSIAAAMATFDFDALAYHIRAFYQNDLGIPPPSGGSGAAAPDPGTIGGGKPVIAPRGKTYTDAEIDELFDKKEAARDRGDWAEVRRLTDEINRAQAAGAAKQ